MKGLLSLRPHTAAAEEVQLLIYGDIGDLGYEGTVKAKDIVTLLAGLKAPSITVRINSYGGRVDEGLAIFNALRAYRGEVTTRVDGVAASIASVIAMAGKRVEMASNAMLMIHAASSFAGGNAADLDNAAESLRKTDRQMAEIYAARTGRSVDEELDALVTQGDRWFTAAEALAAGYIDAIYDPDAEADADEEIAELAALAMRDGLLHHLPNAGAYTGVITAQLKRLGVRPKASAIKPKPTPTAAPAKAVNHQEFAMWKTLALALGITLSADADDTAARTAILKHLALADDADDTAVQAAVSAKLAPAPTAHGRPAGGTDNGRRAQIEEIFTIAAQGRQNAQALNDMRAQALIGEDDVPTVRARVLAHLSAGGGSIAGNSALPHTAAGDDQRDKTREAATGWLLARAGILRGDDQLGATAGNPFNRMNFADMGRACLEDAGVSTRRMNRMDVITAAITHSESDFPNIFENALHRTMLRGFQLQRPSWDRFCKTGSLSDFRPHIRYRGASVGDLQVRGQNGEYRQLTLADAERETITADSKGGILSVTREMLVNDDMAVFTDAAMMLGTSAARTLDKAVFALFALNSGNGPTMGDGNPLFHASHSNIAGTAAAPTVASIEAARVLMAGQKLPGGTDDFLDLRPELFLGPLSVGGQARVVNNSTFDPDANNKLQRSNIVANLFTDIIDTPRLSGTAWYVLANPNIEPVIEVGFLDGISTPQIEQAEAWSQAGLKWRVLYEFGVAGVGYRGIVKNAGQ